MPQGPLKVVLQIVASLTDNSRGVIYSHNMFIVQTTEIVFTTLNFLRNL